MQGTDKPGDGKAIPMSISLPERMKMRVEYEAKKRGFTVSGYIQAAVKEKINFDTELDRMDAEKGFTEKPEDDG